MEKLKSKGLSLHIDP